jgi:hypothetical protein
MEAILPVSAAVDIPHQQPQAEHKSWNKAQLLSNATRDKTQSVPSA